MTRLWYAVTYVAWLVAEILRATAGLARDVFTPDLAVSPAIYEFPLRAASRIEIVSMASSITITPGTLVLAVHAPEGSAERSLYVHFLYPGTREEALAGLTEMESRLLRATRGREEPSA